jgi:hypothetical protein
MENIKELVTDEEINKAWGNADFGIDLSKRDIINNALLKIACEYMIGSTARYILIELGLIRTTPSRKYVLTDNGRYYLFKVFSKEISI